MSSFVQQLSSEIKDSLSWYTGGNFDTFNEAIRNDTKLNDIQEKHLTNIDKAFHDCPININPIVVYRGIHILKPGVSKAFISSSLDYNQALLFANTPSCCVIQITVVPGSKALYLSEISRDKNEQEVLLDRDGILSVTGEYQLNKMRVILVSYQPKSSVVLSAQTETDIDPCRAITVFSETAEFEEDDELETSITEFYDKKIPKQTLKQILETLRGIHDHFHCT